MSTVKRNFGLLVAALLPLIGACRPSTCGWDDALAASNDYTVTLDAPYPSASMTASYSMDDDLARAPIPSCGATFDEVFVSSSFGIRITTPADASRTCGQRTIAITSPTIASTGTYQFELNSHRNQLRAAVTRVIGGGCVGAWEFTVHAPGDDPFATQVADAPPVLLAYRVFLANRGSQAAACATLLGMPAPGPTTDFVCGDAFVATMTTP